MHVTAKNILKDGLSASSIQLPAGKWATLLDFLAANFTTISREAWLSRMQRGLVLDEKSLPLEPDSAYQAGRRIYYFREVMHEEPVPFAENVVYVDDEIVVVDKPHFLPIAPVGEYVQETLLTRLKRRFDSPHLSPLHRIDRATAGLVMFSLRPESRDAYQSLFRDRKVSKRYLALAPPLPHLTFPFTRASRIVRGDPFVLSAEAPGVANSETRIKVEQRGERAWCYRLYPTTGKKHQLRVHMSALGAPIINDDFYPKLIPNQRGDYSRPLQLLAQALEFVDPNSGKQMRFESGLKLNAVD